MMSEVPDGVEFGWGAKPMAEQLPMIRQKDAEHFDKDNDAIIRLHVRGMLTDSQRDAAFKKLTKKIEQSIARALKDEGKHA